MIRTVNDVLPGIKRPFRLQDIEFVWEGLNSALASSVGSTPRILSGFNIKADNNLSAGVIAFNGQLYMHPDTDGYRIPLDSEVYAGSAPSADDMRAFADGTVQNMYWYDVLSTNKTIAEGVEGVLVGAFTKANIEAWSAFGGGGGNTKTFNMAGIYGYLATVNPTTITLNAETLNELSDALSLGKQIILTDMAPYADEMYFMELSLYRRDGQTYYFSLRGYTATGSSTALTANGMGFKRSRGITINMTTGVVNTVTNNMVQLNVHSADGATQNIVSSYPNAVFNFLQNVLIKNVGSVVTGNLANSKRYDAGINANTDVEFNFLNPLYIGSVKAATIEGVESIAVYNRNESTRRVIHTSNEMLVVPSASTIVKTGIGYLTQDGSNYLGYIGANCKGDDANTFFMFMGWGNNPHIPNYNLSVGSNMFKYKNKNIWYDGLTGIINTDALASGAVTNVKLADNSVETSKIQNSAVTNLKLANKNVTIEKLAAQVKPHIALSFRQSSIGGSAQSGITIAFNPYNIVVSNPTWNASWSAYVWSLDKAFPYGFVPIVNISPSGRTGILGYLYYINYDSAGIVIQLRKADGSLLTAEPKGELSINATIIIDDRTIDRWMP